MELFRRFSLRSDLKSSCRSWTGHDENHRHHHGKIPCSERLVDIELCWKADADSPARHVAFLRLHMAGLLVSEFVRTDGDDYIRLRFERVANVVYIQTTSLALKLGADSFLVPVIVQVNKESSEGVGF